MQREHSQIKILSKYDKLFHHLHIEFPELSQLSHKTLETFDVTKRKKDAIYRVLHETVDKTKKKQVTPKEHLGEIDREEAFRFLFDSAEKCTTRKMSRFQIRDIRNLIKVPELQEKYADKLEEMFQEVREEYLEVTHALGVVKKIKGTSEKLTELKIKPFKFLGKTERYNVFLWLRKELKNKLMLHRPLLRSIILQFDTLPQILFNIQRKNSVKMNFEDLEFELQKNLVEASQCIQQFYENIEKMVQKDTMDVHSTLVENYLGSCTCAITIHLSQIIENTLNHIVEVTNCDKMPFLNLYVTFNTKMELFPTSEQLSELFQCLLKDTIVLTKPLKVLQGLKIPKFRNKRIEVYLTNEYLNGLLIKVQKNVEVVYEYVLKYLKDLNENFEEIYTDINNNICVSDLNFEIGFEKIKYYKSFSTKISLIPKYELISMGEVILSDYISKLKGILNSLIDQLFSALASQSHWEIVDILENFQIIKARSEIVPMTTEQTIEIGKYMTWVKSEFLLGISDRIGAALMKLASLLEIGSLQDYHINLSVKLVKELDEIEPLVDDNLAKFEQLKFEAEEKLQKHIENVNEITKEIHPILYLLDEMDDILRIRQYISKINRHLLKIKSIETQISWINVEEVALSFPKSSYPEFEEVKNYVYPFFHLMKLSLNVQRNISIWLDGQFDLQSYDETKVKVEEYQEELSRMQKSYRKKLRQAQDDNLQMRFKGTVDDPDILNWPAPLKICSKTMKLVEEFQPCISLMKIVCNPSLRIRHWRKMSCIAKIDLLPNAGSTLRKLMIFDLKPFLDPLEAISQGASHEQELLDNINEMKNQWLPIKLKGNFFGKTDWIVFENLNEVIKLCRETVEKLLIISRSAFAGPHRETIENFRNDLMKLEEILIIYELLQTKFFHLLPFFIFINSIDENSNQSVEFQRIQTFKKKLYFELNSDNIFDISKNYLILKEVHEHYKLFETIYYSVREYLETVREKFPRFYFLSDEELIELLSHATEDFKILQDYFSKCFKCISKLKIESGNIQGLKSITCEEIDFSCPIEVKKNLVETFSSVKKGIFENLVSEVEKTVKKNFRHEEIVSSHLGQAVLVALEIFCTNLSHQAFKDNKSSFNEIEFLFEQYTGWMRQKSFSNSLKKTLRNMIVSLVHHMELIQEIIEKNITENDFEWFSRIKYYLENGKCVVRTLDLSLNYGYEYFGNISSCISTFHTERCVVSILNAYNSFYNSAVHGETNSGKSQVLENLAMALGVNFMSIPCTKTFSYDILKQFVIGSYKSNTWIFLEEINKVDVSVLSLISDLLQSFKNLTLMSDKIELRGFICVTLNSSFSKITDLPFTFKSRFRYVGIVAPDFKRLCEVTLVSIGYKNATEISKCVGTLFEMMPDVLFEISYEFSLNLLKKILDICDEESEISCDEEKSIVLNALRSNIEPMLTSADAVLFEDLLVNIFGSCSNFDRENSELKEKVIFLLKNRNLNPFGDFVDKILQVGDAISSRKNLILLGDICTGKTSSISVLHELLVSGNGDLDIINPAIFEASQLYGFMDSKHSLWKDGILTKILKKFSKKQNCWVVFDGSIEASWMEAFGSVLDKGRVITLGSGELLKIRRSNSILFEVTDLKHASPTIASRCTVVYFETSKEPWSILLEPWIKKHYNSWPETIQHLLEDLLFWLIPPLLKFVQKNCVEQLPIGDFCLMKNTINYVQIYLSQALAKRDEDIKNLTIWLQAGVFQGIYNGLSSTLCHSSLLQFDQYFKLLSKNQIAEYPLPKRIDKIDISVPTEGLFSEYFYIYKGRGNFKYIPDTLKNEKILQENFIDDVLVPTTETVKNLTILDMHISNHFPILLFGPTTSGKTLCVNHYLNHTVDKSKYSSMKINFVPRLTSSKLQSTIHSNLTKNISFHKEDIKKRNLIVIEDLNVVSLNENKISPVIEFLRYVLDYKFWHDRANFEKYSLENLGFIFVATMGPKSGPNKSISKRLLKYFSILRTNDVSDENILRIFSGILVVSWKQNGFTSDVQMITNSLAHATLNVYEYCRKNLNPRYFFGLWDITKALRGLFLLKKEAVDANKKIYFKLWTHEIIRVFGDRLSNIQEKNSLYKEIICTFENQFKESFDETFNGLTVEDMDWNIIFGSFTTKYEEIEHKDVVEAIGDTIKKKCNSGVKILLFEEFLTQIVKIIRLLSIEKTNGLLLGSSGTGRRTLTELASIVLNCETFTPHIFFDYNITKWREDFKKILFKTGGNGAKSVMYLNEEHLNHDFILEDINFFLKNGNIIDLFEVEEEPGILDMVRLDAQNGNPNLNISSEDVYSFFVNRCKTNLHIILSFNCETTVSLTRMSYYQSLVKFCTPIYFNKWTDDALIEIAKEMILECEFSEDVSQSNLPKMIVCIFRGSESNYNSCSGESYVVKTASYVEFLKLYVEIMAREQKAINEKKKKYLTGLGKLKCADDQITKLQEHLVAYHLQLKIMAKKAAEMTRQIARETLEVERASDLVKKDEKVANRQAEAAAVLKLDCEADLAQAIPILEDAIQALNTLKPSDITLVKSMKNPPDAIKLVMAAVCVIKDVKPDRIPDPSTGRKLIDYWGPSKRILGDMNFLQTLKDFDKDHIKAEIMVKIRKDYLPHKDFKPHVVAKASSAAEGLCKWIIAMDMYDNVAKEVAPKKEKLEKSEREYAQTVAILDEKKLEVVRLEKQLAQLNSKLKEANKKQQRLQRTSDACNRKLERAITLISGFEKEKLEWSKQVENLERKYECLIGDVLLTCSTISYLSATPEIYRNEILKNWKILLKDDGLKYTEDWNLMNSLVSNEKQFSRGLPEDNYFIENCIIHEYSYKWPLCIDPHGSAIKWLKKTINSNILRVVKYRDTQMIEEIENCVKSGKCVVIENPENEISGPLNQLLKRETTGKNGEELIFFEGKMITYHKNFKLFMTASSNSGKYKSEFLNKIKLLNFTLTESSLQKKLLSIVIKTESPLISNQMKILRRKQRENENFLRKNDVKILETLSNAEDDLLEDHNALKILDDTKKSSLKAEQAVYSEDAMVSTFEQLEKSFTDFSRLAKTLFFSCEKFSKKNGIIKLSYECFIEFYKKSILTAPLASVFEKRIKILTSFLTLTVTKLMKRMISTEDNLKFLFNMCIDILIFRGNINPSDFQFFINQEMEKNKLIYENMRVELNDEFLDLNKELFMKNYCKMLKNLEQLEIFTGLEESAKLDKVSWDSFLSLEDPEKYKIPDPWERKLTSFQKFLLLRTLRIDRTKQCIKKFISLEFGEEYIRPIKVDLEELYSESFCLSPIIFLTTNRGSPLRKIKNFAVRKRVKNKLRCLSLGGNNCSTAELLVEEGQKEGLWICLGNCHLSKSWPNILENICENMSFENTHQNFRLWLIADISIKFSDQLLEKCVKIVYQESECFKENLLVSYNDFIDDLNVQENKSFSPQVSKLIYRLICFHSVLIWREKFGGTAWNRPFEFSQHDLQFAVEFLPNLIKNYGYSESSLKYLVGECCYSTQFSNEIDYEASRNLFDDFFIRLESCPFSLPSKSDFHDFISHIEKLPDEETAELLGFNEIILYRRHFEESSLFFSQNLEYRNFQTELLLEIVEKTLELLNVQFSEKKNIDKTRDLMQTILQTEIELHEKLVNSIIKYLKKIQTNNFEFSSDLIELWRDLSVNKIPKIFLKYSYLTDETFSTYIQNLRRRLLFFDDWNKNSIVETYWISFFFHPNALLAAQRIIYSRQSSGECLENYSKFYEIEDISEGTKGFSISGLYLINAKFDKLNRFVELLPKNVYFHLMPPINIRPAPLNREYYYKCPVYRNDKRIDVLGTNKKHLKNYIFSIDLKTNVQRNVLVKFGVALTCEGPRKLLDLF